MRDTIWKDREVKSGDSVIKERDAAIPCLARVMVRVMVGAMKKTRSSWLNCALRDDEAVYWVSIGHYEAVAVGN